MKRSFLLLAALLCITVSSFAQMPDTLRRRDPGGWEFIQVVQGPLVVAEGKTHDGLQEGVWTTFWENRLPHTLTSYAAGKKNGSYVEIRRTGQVEWLVSYTNDSLDGPSRKYYPGANIAEETYYSRGVRSGTHTRWYLNGPIQEQTNYNRNVRDGKSVFYNEKGQKMAEYTYNLGKLEGDAAIYADSGRISESGAYANDNKAGVWKEFYPDGKLKAEGNYENGEKTGSWKQFDENGKELKPVTYKKASGSKKR
jgi:antitoxin component YwqK of YwqJK toxin-antitoxin module